MSERAVLDTNVIIHGLDPKSPLYAPCAALLQHAATADAGLCVASQVLGEFYAIVTDRRRVAEPRKPEEALDAIAALLERPGLEVLPVPTDVVSRWTELVRRHPVTGGDVFDLQLVATMLGNGVRCIYTFNVDDFTPFAELEVLRPDEAVTVPTPTESGVSEETPPSPPERKR